MALLSLISADGWQDGPVRRWPSYPLSPQMGGKSEDPRRWPPETKTLQMAPQGQRPRAGRDGAPPQTPAERGPNPFRTFLVTASSSYRRTVALRLKGAIIALAEPETQSTCWRRGGCLWRGGARSQNG